MNQTAGSKKTVALFAAAVVLGAAIAAAVVWHIARRAPTAPSTAVHGRRVAGPTKPVFLILCAGDSHTEGTGVPKGVDYPSQLKVMLNNEASKSKEYHVVNIGHSGWNTSESALAALDFIDSSEIPPDVVIFNAGKANGHNFNEARIFPDPAQRVDSAAGFKHLAEAAAGLRFNAVTVEHLNKLAKTAPRYEQTQWGSVLDVTGEREREYLATWITLDVMAVLEACRKVGAKLCLLNYWDDASPWVDRTYAALGKQKGAAFIDMRNFGNHIANFNQAEDLIQKNYIPNEKGFALIAETIFNYLSSHHLLPSDSGAEPPSRAGG